MFLPINCKDIGHAHPDDEIIYNFIETQAEVLDYLQKNPFEHSFDWKKVLKEGKTRRVSMDYKLKKVNNRSKIGLTSRSSLTSEREDSALNNQHSGYRIARVSK